MPGTKGEKKALKKAKAKEKNVGMDELDQVLAEMALKCVITIPPSPSQITFFPDTRKHIEAP